MEKCSGSPPKWLLLHFENDRKGEKSSVSSAGSEAAK